MRCATPRPWCRQEWSASSRRAPLTGGSAAAVVDACGGIANPDLRACFRRRLLARPTVRLLRRCRSGPATPGRLTCPREGYDDVTQLPGCCLVQSCPCPLVAQSALIFAASGDLSPSDVGALPRHDPGQDSTFCPGATCFVGCTNRAAWAGPRCQAPGAPPLSDHGGHHRSGCEREAADSHVARNGPRGRLRVWSSTSSPNTTYWFGQSNHATMFDRFNRPGNRLGSHQLHRNAGAEDGIPRRADPVPDNVDLRLLRRAEHPGAGRVSAPTRRDLTVQPPILCG